MQSGGLRAVLIQACSTPSWPRAWLLPCMVWGAWRASCSLAIAMVVVAEEVGEEGAETRGSCTRPCYSEC
jgi:hypothetical protein